jgi:adenine phosphoribosyltransferase
LRDIQGFNKVIDDFVDKLKGLDFDYIIGVESRGFLFSSALSLKLNKGQLLLRKKGKLPGTTTSVSFEKEYGSDTFEI